MAKISVLDQNTINQIAAGEVVERPSSVVKELIENAIDAGATAITAEIKEGGLSLIRITDNGCGIEKEEVPSAFLQHATSKIKSAEDLLTIGSLGFRGEALSSIAAVAKVELITKTRTAFTGVRYVIEGGEEKGCFEIGCPEGTTFLIQDLFFNTPARRKFLKSPMTEAGYISDLMERLSVSHPEVSFKFINNNKTVLHTFGNGNLKDIIYHVFGRDIAAQVLEVHYGGSAAEIDGYIGKPSISRGNRNYENYFINGRYIKSSVISKAIEEAYKPYSMQHKYPFTVLHFKIDPSFIDVNVHPTKMEIRFSNAETIFQSVYHSIRDTLSGKNMIPKVTFTEEKKEPQKIIPSIPEPFETKRLNQVKEESDVPSKPVIPSKTLHEIRGVAEAQREREMKEMNNSAFLSDTIGLKKIPFVREEPKVVQTPVPLVTSKETDYISKEAPPMPPVPVTGMQQTLFDEPEQEGKECIFKDYRIIGQIFSTYWMVESAQQLYMIDQHAAHEKILFEQTIKRLKEKEFSSQLISPPIVLTLSPREEDVIKQQKEVLENLGFVIEAFGGKEYSVSAVPSDMLGISGKDLLLEFIDGLADEAKNTASELMLEKAASISCKAAVKGNHSMSELEAKEMITKLLTLDNPFHCPHGRPVIISMTKYEIEKKFKRVL